MRACENNSSSAAGSSSSRVMSGASAGTSLVAGFSEGRLLRVRLFGGTEAFTRVDECRVGRGELISKRVFMTKLVLSGGLVSEKVSKVSKKATVRMV